MHGVHTMTYDFGDYVNLYLSQLVRSHDRAAIEWLWAYAQKYITKRHGPIKSVVVEGHLLNRQDAAWLSKKFTKHIRLLRIVALWPDRIEFDIFHRFPSDDPEALARIRIEISNSKILWSTLSFRNKNIALVPLFLSNL